MDLDPQGLQGIRIFRTPTNFPLVTEGEGPFKSLRGLKKNSSIYRKLKSTNSKRARKIEENIFTASDGILTPAGSTYSNDFLNIFIHATKGRVKNGKVSGVHFYNPGKIKIVDEEIIDNKTGVWKAEIEYFDKNTNKWIPKKEASTFFPKHWTRTELFHECDFAHKRMKKKPNTEHLYTSMTISNIPVEIVKKENKLISIYPLIDQP